MYNIILISVPQFAKISNPREKNTVYLQKTGCNNEQYYGMAGTNPPQQRAKEVKRYNKWAFPYG
ncbi:MAG: hypothetical protein IIU86_02060, partial [Oscillospiraceae bacterium]|nr:hypothetical protein [Oscillospiraceae bacterium]